MADDKKDFDGIKYRIETKSPGVFRALFTVLIVWAVCFIAYYLFSGWSSQEEFARKKQAKQESLAKQKKSVQREFEDRVEKTILAFAEQGLNAVLYYENKSFARNVSLVPTSAITGEGVPDMIMLLINLTQQRMSDREILKVLEADRWRLTAMAVSSSRTATIIVSWSTTRFQHPTAPPRMWCLDSQIS